MPFIRVALANLFFHLVAFSGPDDLVPRNPQSLLFPPVPRSEVIGLVAGFGTTFAALPQFISMLRRRSAAGVNPSMSAIMAIFQVLWVYYGFLIASRPVIIWNVIGVLMNSLSVGAYFHFSRREREPASA